MSVVGYTSNEMWSMLKGIYTLEYSGHQYTNYIGFTDEDYHTIEKDYAGDKLEYLRTSLSYFFQSLYIANQIAVIVQYGFSGRHPDVSLCLNKDFPPEDATKNLIETWSSDKLLTKLELLRYNMYTNAGRAWISKIDEAKLDRIIGGLKTIVIEEGKGELMSQVKSPCVKDCIDTKREHGKEIDKQALAICYSECGN